MFSLFEKLKSTFNKLVERLTTVELSEKAIEDLHEELLLDLVDSDVAYDVAEYIIESLKEKIVGVKLSRFDDKRKVIRTKLREVLLDTFKKVGDLDLVEYVNDLRKSKRPVVILFLGPNGHGKTTTIAKVAKLLMKYGMSVVVAASDTFRAGAIEQIEEHCRRVGVKVIKHRYGADPAAVAYDAIMHAKSKGIDVVLIDTAGRMQTDRDLMDEMKKITRVTSPDLKVFVGDALTGNDALEEAMKFNEEVGIDCSILTKVDADVKGGTALSVVYATNRPIAYIGTGQGYLDIEKFNAEWFVDKILGSEN